MFWKFVVVKGTGLTLEILMRQRRYILVVQVSVTSKSPPGYGETMANVTVLPLQRINTPPKAVIVPARQIVTLPTNKVI